MAISAISNIGKNESYVQSPAAEIREVNQTPIQMPQTNVVQAVKLENESDKQELNNGQQELNHEQAQKISAEMNKFMRLLNSNIRFVLHEKTNVRMVQVVDSADNTVLKEFPSHNLLDIKGKIREYVGVLLDKHI